MELSRSDLLPRKPTVKSLAGWQPPAIAPSDLPRVHAKGTELPLIGCYHPMTKLSAVPETENFCPTWNSPHGRSLLWTHHQPDQGFVLVWGTFCTTYTVPLSLHGGETYIAVWRPSPLAMYAFFPLSSLQVFSTMNLLYIQFCLGICLGSEDLNWHNPL